MFSFHRRPSRTIALSATTSFRITATSATFDAFPRATNPL